MENQSQRNKISTSDIYYPKRDVFTSNGQRIPQTDEAKYLGIHLNCRLNWKKHIFTKRKLGLQLGKMYWLFGRKLQLLIENKLLLYKAMLKPIWAYGIQQWDMASNSSMEILQRF